MQHMSSACGGDRAGFAIHRRLVSQWTTLHYQSNLCPDEMPMINMEDERRASYEHYQAINAFLHSIHRPRPSDEGAM